MSKMRRDTRISLSSRVFNSKFRSVYCGIYLTNRTLMPDIRKLRELIVPNKGDPGDGKLLVA